MSATLIMLQKFETGDLVKVKRASIFHAPFFEAIILGSYSDLYGHSSFIMPEYSIFTKDHGPMSWFMEDELELIKANQIALLRKWREEYYTK